MTYSVLWMKGEDVVGNTPFPSFALAKSHAIEHFPVHQTQRGGDRVEVRDETGALRFHHPRTLHP